MPVEPSSMPRRGLPSVLVIILGVLVVILIQRGWFGGRAGKASDFASMHPPSTAKQADAGANGVKTVPVPRHLAADQPIRVAGIPAGDAGNSQAMMLKLDRRFRGENLDLAWAALHEQAVSNAIAGTEHDGFDVPLPQSLDVRCRSSMCSIRMSYQDEGDAANMQAKLMLGMPATLSTAYSFYLPNPRGGTDLLVYAGKLR